MLKGIDPLLTPRLLMLLAQMGHGDEIVIADANFTATTLARRPPVELPGAGVARACAAVMSVFPLDAAVAQPVATMQVGGSAPGYHSALQREVIAGLAHRGWADPAQCEAMERFAFYDRVKNAFAVVRTGELQPWANFLFRKGVLGAALEP